MQMQAQLSCQHAAGGALLRQIATHMQRIADHLSAAPSADLDSTAADAASSFGTEVKHTRFAAPTAVLVTGSTQCGV